MPHTTIDEPVTSRGHLRHFLNVTSNLCKTSVSFLFFRRLHHLLKINHQFRRVDVGGPRSSFHPPLWATTAPSSYTHTCNSSIGNVIIKTNK